MPPMSRKEINTAYRAAVEALAPSADSMIEELRSRIIRAEIADMRTTPETLSSLCQMPGPWGYFAFKELRLSGFIENRIDSFRFARLDENYLGNSLDQLAALESAICLRSSRVNLAPLQPEIDFRAAELKRISEGQCPLASAFALQKLLLTLVAGIGTLEMLNEYTPLATPAFCYRWSADMAAEDVIALAGAGAQIAEQLKARQGELAARLCAAMRQSVRSRPHPAPLTASKTVQRAVPAGRGR